MGKPRLVLVIVIHELPRRDPHGKARGNGSNSVAPGFSPECVETSMIGTLVPDDISPAGTRRAPMKNIP